MTERIAIIDGLRSPFCKAGGAFKGIEADDLGAVIVKELLLKSDFPKDQIDEVILGCAGQPAHAANIARVISLKAGLPNSQIAYTVHRNCASGMESITTAVSKIRAGEGDVYLVGGVESMSNIPLMFNKKMTNLFIQLMKARNPLQKLKALLSFRPSFLAPIIAVQQGLTDPVSGMNMGNTAEVLAREFHISREEQDGYALLSHHRAERAKEKLSQEIHPLMISPEYKKLQDFDDGIRLGQSMEALAKLRPYFDRKNGTVTVGNSCGLTDGACALILTSETKAKELGYTPLGYLNDFAYAGLEPERMGLGPVYATAKLFKKTGRNLKQMELIELNEAFAAQVIANERAFDSLEFAKKHLGLDKELGGLDRDFMNVNGGAISLGHPVGATGARMVLTLLKDLNREEKQTGLATLCIGGGQGAAIIVERE